MHLFGPVVIYFGTVLLVNVIFPHIDLSATPTQNRQREISRTRIERHMSHSRTSHGTCMHVHINR